MITARTTHTAQHAIKIYEKPGLACCTTSTRACHEAKTIAQYETASTCNNSENARPGEL